MTRHRVATLRSIPVAIALTFAVGAASVGAQADPPPGGGGAGTVTLLGASTPTWNEVVVDSAGRPVTLTVVDAGGAQSISIVTCDNTTCTGAVTVANQAAIDTGTRPDVEVDASNRPVMAYNVGSTVQLRRCDDLTCSGTGEVTSTALDVTASLTPVATQLELGPSGFPTIVTEFHGTDGAKSLVVTRCNDANCAGNNESHITVFQAGPSTSDAPLTPSMVLDASGNPRIALIDRTFGTALGGINCTDPACVSRSRFTSMPIGEQPTAPSIAVDSTGKVVIAYHDSNADELRILRCVSDCDGNSPTNTRTLLESRGAAPSLQLDASGRPVIASVGSGGVAQLIHCNDTNCIGGDDDPLTLPSSTGTSELQVSLALGSLGDGIVTFANPSLQLYREALCQGLLPTVYLELGQTPTTGADVIMGTNSNDTVDALAGNDKICTLDGDDFIIAGPGNDGIDAGPGNDWSAYTTNTARIITSLSTVSSGSSGSDTLTSIENIWGSPFDDIINGNTADNILVGDAGTDSISGGDGHDQLYGDQPIPTGTPSPNTLDGGSGNDYVQGGNADDTIDAGPGNDQVYGLAGNDTIEGDAGDDILLGNDGDDTLAGDDGNDYLEPGPGTGSQITTTTNGGPGNDWIQAGQSFTSVFGGTGNDVILAGAEPLLADGGAGNDYFRGSPLGDQIITGPDFGAEADLDWVETLAGNDSITGAIGVDIVFAGDGDDTASTRGAADYVNGGPGNDTLNGNDGDDYIEGGTGNDTITTGNDFGTAYGQDGNDTLDGGPTTDFLDGGPGEDILFGVKGDDFLVGGDGNNDNVNGGPGDDTLFGGNGTNDICSQNAVTTPGFTAYDASCETKI